MLCWRRRFIAAFARSSAFAFHDRNSSGVVASFCRRRHGTSSAIVHAQGAARIEAIPAEPQGEGAQHNQWKIVAFELFRILEATLARSQDNSAHQAGYATRQVDHASKWKQCDMWRALKAAGDHHGYTAM